MRAHYFIVFVLCAVVGGACVSGAPKPMLEATPPLPAPEPIPAVAVTHEPPPAKTMRRKRAAKSASGSRGTGRGGGGQHAVDPRISFSRGQDGGFIVLWPRVIPSKPPLDVNALLPSVQAQTSSITTRIAAGRSVDVRPKPQRVCPASGCKATSLGVLLLHNQGGCAAVALISAPGQSNTQLVPWAGDVVLKSEYIAFRDPPENHITVRDFVPCDELVDSLSTHEKRIEMSVRNAGFGG